MYRYKLSVYFIFKGYNYHYKCCHGHLPSRKDIMYIHWIIKGNKHLRKCARDIYNHMTSILALIYKLRHIGKVILRATWHIRKVILKAT